MGQQFSFVLVLQGRINAGSIRQAVRLAMDAEPIFGCRYVPVPRQPYWERRDDLDKLPLCEVIDAVDIEEEVTRFVSRPCDAALDPLVQACILRGNDDALCVKINHAAADGAGAKELLHVIASFYRALENGGGRAALEVVPNFGRRGLGQLLRQFDGRSYWRAARGKDHKPVESQWRFPSDNRSETDGVLLALRRFEPEQFDSMKTRAKQFQVTLNDYFVAACFRSLWEFLDFPAGIPQSICVPLNGRVYLPSGRTGSICNFSLPLYSTLERIPREPIGRTAQRVRLQMPHGTERSQHVLSFALAAFIAHRLAMPRLKTAIHEAHRRKLFTGCTTVTLTNNGALDPARLDFGLPVKDAWQTHPAAFGADLIVGVVSFLKKLTFTVSYPGRAVKSEHIERFLDAFAGQLWR